VIVIGLEPAFKDHPKVLFEKCFYNEDTKVQAWSQVKGVGHYCKGL